MTHSYRNQAERRNILSRATSVPASRSLRVKPLLDLPPWGYGAGRQLIPAPTINGSRRLNRARLRSASSSKQHANSCCDTAVAPSALSNSVTYGHGADELNIVDQPKNNDESDVKRDASNGITGMGVATTAPVPTLKYPFGLNDTTDTIIGGGLVVSSSMETWTTNEETSTPPRIQSALSSLHTVVTAQQNNIPRVDTQPRSLPSPSTTSQSAASSSHQCSPTVNDATMLSENMANHNTDAPTTPASLLPDVHLSSSSQKSITSDNHMDTVQRAITDGSPKVTLTSLLSTDTLKVTSPVNSASRQGSASMSLTSSKNEKEAANQSTSPATTSMANDHDRSSLMVGLVKVKSRHTGLMIDCPILETHYQDATVESALTPVRQSGSHKVVLIKAVVPRWAWNGQNQFTPESSSRESTPTTLHRIKTVDRKSSGMSNHGAVSVNSVDTQTSDTLLPARRTVSEHLSTKLPLTVEAMKCVAALSDNCQLVPSPKLSATSAKRKLTSKTSAEGNIRSTPTDSCFRSPNITSYQSRAQNQSLSAAETSTLPTHPLRLGDVLITSEMHKQSDSVDRRSITMEDTVENLKLDLCFSSSDSDSAKKTSSSGKRCVGEPLGPSSSSSSDDMGCVRDQSSSSVQAMATHNWSCAATAATASYNTLDNFAISSHVDDMIARIDASPAPPSHQCCGRSAPASQASSPASRVKTRVTHIDDNSNERQSSANSSRRNSVRERLISETCSRPQKSPCAWRSSTMTEQGRRSSRDTSDHQPNQYERDNDDQQRKQSYQLPGVDSSHSDCSKSSFHDCSEVALTTAPDQWIGSVTDHDVTSGAESDRCAVIELTDDVSTLYSRPADEVAQFITVDDAESRQRHHKSTPVDRHREVEPKGMSTQQRYKCNSASGALKRSGEIERRCGKEARQRDELAQSSQLTGSMALASRNSRSPPVTGNATVKRQNSSSATRRRVSRDDGKDKHGQSVDRRMSSSCRQSCFVGGREKQRQRSQTHSNQQPSSDPASRRSLREASTSSGRFNQRRDRRRSTHASQSRSADSMSLGRAGRLPSTHANHATSVAKSSSSNQQRQRNDIHEQRHPTELAESPTTLHDQCRQHVVYCSPRSLRLFPPPVSDRDTQPTFDSSTASAFIHADTVNYSFVQGNKDDVSGQPNDPRKDFPSPSSPCRHEHLRHSGQTGSEESQHQRRMSAVDSNDNDSRGRRRKTPVIDKQGACAEKHITVSSIVERPMWKR